MTLIEKTGRVEIWESVTDWGKGPVSEFYVYEGERLARVCPSIGMAREVAAGCR